MDFDDTPAEAAFRAEARAFLEAHASRRTSGSAAERSRSRNPSPEAQAAHIEASPPGSAPSSTPAGPA